MAMNGTTPAPWRGGPRRRCGRSGLRHWFRTTGLPGWKRAELGMPAFGDSQCALRSRPVPGEKLFHAVKRWFGRRAGAHLSPTAKLKGKG